jgi:hypothetical protein
MVLLCSTAGTELFKQFVLQVMCYPNGYVISDVPWGLDRVRTDCLKSDALKTEDALIVFVDYYEDQKTLEPRAVYLPLRRVKIVNARNYAGKLLLDLRTDDFVYYGPDVARVYDADREGTAVSVPPAQRWNERIGAQDGVLKAIATSPNTAMRYKDFPSWQSGGMFVLQLRDTAGEPGLDFAAPPDVRAQHNDWRSVVDRIAPAWQMQGKLFYQLDLFESASKTPRSLAGTFGGKTVYGVASGDCVELLLHFYFGAGVDRHGLVQTLLEVTTDPTYLAIVGNTSIQIYPNQSAGKIETLQLVLKPQLAEAFTRVRMQQRSADTATGAALATVEIYLRILPRRLFISILVGLFFAGSFLNALPQDLGTLTSNAGWVAKLLGSLLMAGAFWIGFSKLPSKGG